MFSLTLLHVAFLHWLFFWFRLIGLFVFSAVGWFSSQSFFTLDPNSLENLLFPSLSSWHQMALCGWLPPVWKSILFWSQNSGSGWHNLQNSKCLRGVVVFHVCSELLILPYIALHSMFLYDCATLTQNPYFGRGERGGWQVP